MNNEARLRAFIKNYFPTSSGIKILVGYGTWASIAQDSSAMKKYVGTGCSGSGISRSLDIEVGEVYTAAIIPEGYAILIFKEGGMAEYPPHYKVTDDFQLLDFMVL